MFNDLFPSSDPLVTAATMPMLCTSSRDNNNDDNNDSNNNSNSNLNPSDDMSTATMPIDYAEKQGLDSPRELANGRQPPLERWRNDPVQLLTQLCELNVALFQHPLHQDRDATQSPKLSATESTNHAPAGNSNLMGGHPLPDLNVADLGIGNLLQMTAQLKELILGLQSLEHGTVKKGEGIDQSTKLMALSCYMRLDILYSHINQLLLQIRSGSRHLKDIDQLMVNLVIDGFSINKCYSVQLDFLIHLYKQAHEQIHSCIQSGGKGLSQVIAN